MTNFFLIFYTNRVFARKKKRFPIYLFTLMKKRDQKSTYIKEYILPQISALFEPILNSTPSISALLLLLAQKERCIHGDFPHPHP